MFSCAIVTWIVVTASVGVVAIEGNVVRNASVSVVALENERQPFGVETTIKLNVSWLPPENDSRFFFYRVIVQRVRVNSRNGTDNVYQSSGNVKEVPSFCPEGSIYYVGQDVNQTHVLLPEDRFGASDGSVYQLHIEPACSYAVQIFANPTNDVGATIAPSTSTVFTVPECVGKRCNCEAMLDVLPVPVVSVTNPYNGGTLISWKIELKKLMGTHHQTDIKSYRISIEMPYSVSSNDVVVYNKTIIFTGVADDNSFYWNQEKLKKGTKILMTVQDIYGCSGREGTYTVKRLRHHTFYRKNIAAIIFAGLVALCLLISGLFNVIKYFIQNHNYKLFSWGHKTSRQLTSALLPKAKIELFLKNKNIVYPDDKIKINS